MIWIWVKIVNIQVSRQCPNVKYDMKDTSFWSRHGIDPRKNNRKIIFLVKKSFIIDKKTNRKMVLAKVKRPNSLKSSVVSASITPNMWVFHSANCCWKEWVSECLTVCPNKFKYVTRRVTKCCQSE